MYIRNVFYHLLHPECFFFLSCCSHFHARTMLFRLDVAVFGHTKTIFSTEILNARNFISHGNKLHTACFNITICVREDVEIKSAFIFHSQAMVLYASTFMIVALSIDRVDAIARPMKFTRKGVSTLCSSVPHPTLIHCGQST